MAPTCCVAEPSQWPAIALQCPCAALATGCSCGDGPQPPGRRQNTELRFGSHVQAEMSELLDDGAPADVGAKLSLSLPACDYPWFRGTRLHR